MKKQVTAEQVRAIVSSNYEGEVFEEVLEILRRHEGKPFTKRIVDQFPGGSERWRIDRTYQHSLIVRQWLKGPNGGYVEGTSLYVPTEGFLTNKAKPVDAAEFERKNPAAFAGRRERDAKRLVCKNDAMALQYVADTINEILRAKEALELAVGRFDDLTISGPFSADRYSLKDLFEGEPKP